MENHSLSNYSKPYIIVSLRTYWAHQVKSHQPQDLIFCGVS